MWDHDGKKGWGVGGCDRSLGHEPEGVRAIGEQVKKKTTRRLYAKARVEPAEKRRRSRAIATTFFTAAARGERDGRHRGSTDRNGADPIVRLRHVFRRQRADEACAAEQRKKPPNLIGRTTRTRRTVNAAVNLPIRSAP